jgi:hypothetical protein
MEAWAEHSEHCPGDKPGAEHGSALFARRWGYHREAQASYQKDREA